MLETGPGVSALGAVVLPESKRYVLITVYWREQIPRLPTSFEVMDPAFRPSPQGEKPQQARSLTLWGIQDGLLRIADLPSATLMPGYPA